MQLAPTTNIRLAISADVDACKHIADQLRSVFGFLSRGVFTEAIERQQLLIATSSTERLLTGFVRFNHRVRGTETALYDIGVHPQWQRNGVGTALVQALRQLSRSADRSAIVLRCPTDLPANTFYQRIGFQYVATEQGRRRALNVWRLLTRDDVCIL